MRSAMGACPPAGVFIPGREQTAADSPRITHLTFVSGRTTAPFYSGCKALGEECLDGAENCFAWRLRIPFNHVDSPRNYLSKLMRYERLLDVENSISQLDEFVSVATECWTRRVEYGIYNITNTGSMTTRQVAEMLNRHLVPEKAFHFFQQ